MSILKIARMGHPILRKKARPIEPAELKSAAIQKLIDDMIETMHEYRGIGLAAPQVHEGIRLFVAGVMEDDDNEQDERALRVIPLINPEIKPVGGEPADDCEGCLSIPDIRALVTRPRRIRVKALDRRGQRVELDVRDYPARVMLHENDHLDGILFLDRVKRYDSLTYIEEMERYHQREREPVTG
jgi:peptide deformylase